MDTQDYKSFLSSRKVERISELEKEDLLAFAKVYMNDVSSTSISRLMQEVDGITPDWKEVASWVERAFAENKRFYYGVIDAESFDPKYISSSQKLEYGII